MDDVRKVRSVLELSKYKIGDVAYWVVLRPNVLDDYELKADDKWMTGYHPKVLFERGYSKTWSSSKGKVPSLHAHDFCAIVGLLTSKMIVDSYRISHVVRSRNTGEFIYCNNHSEWMPESMLYNTRKLAETECTRIRKLIWKWSGS